MTIAEQKNYFEWLKSRLWKAVFKGTANRGTQRQLDYCFQELEKLRLIEFPNRKRDRR